MPFINILNEKFEKKEDIATRIYKAFENEINTRFNCGGYALEIFDWVNVLDKDNDVMVTHLLSNPSVRLLGETLLSDDEYLVVFDAASYHFIKYKDGKFIEKMR